MIGVLGGIGPEATAIFYRSLIQELQLDMHSNTDLPRIVINSIPAPELVRHPVTQEELAPYRDGLLVLDRLEPEFIVMVCNTIHLYLDEFRMRIRAPILDLRAVVRNHLVERGATRVGIVGTAATVTQGLYASDVYETLTPTTEELELLGETIVRFNRGERPDEQRQRAARVVDRLTGDGAQVVVLACTEFAAMLAGTPDTVDTIGLLVEATARRSRGGGTDL